MGVEAMGLKFNECVVFEDVEKGVDVVFFGGFYVVGVGGDNLKYVYYVVFDFINFIFNDIL